MWIGAILALAAEPALTTVTLVERTMGVRDDGELFSNTREQAHGPEDVDVDGDGTPDRVVPVYDADACGWSLRYEVWLRRADGWVRAGEVVGVPRRDEGRISTSTVQVVATGPMNRPPVGRGAEPPLRRETTRTYRLSGDRVELVEERVEEGGCHHCGVTDCLDARRVEP